VRGLPRRLLTPPKLLRDVLLNDGHAVEFLLPFFLVGFHVVLFEMCDVFRVCEVFLFRIWKIVSFP